jgi:pimeloyl-ACP methyl ester carboxylesterase
MVRTPALRPCPFAALAETAMKPQTAHRTIVFSHANSFPARTYEALFESWRQAGYEVHALDKFGHDARYPVTINWPHLVAQLKDFIEREVSQPAWLVGHSLGGYLSMMAASRYPHLSQGVVIMDSPVLHGWKSAGLGLAQRLGTIDRVIVPARVASQRTYEWHSLQGAREHFSAKPKFAAFHPRVLQDYLVHGTESHLDGQSRRLSFRREIEAAIYSAMPHDLLQEFRRHPHQCPLAFIGGQHSSETRRIGIQGIKQLVGRNLSWIDGSHLYPFELPELTADEVLKWLHHFQASARATEPLAFSPS